MCVCVCVLTATGIETHLRPDRKVFAILSLGRTKSLHLFFLSLSLSSSFYSIISIILIRSNSTKNFDRRGKSSIRPLSRNLEAACIVARKGGGKVSARMGNQFLS